MRKLILISLMLLSVVLAACSGNQNSGVAQFNPYIGGTEGVRMEFIEGLPPTQEGAILDNGKSSFGVGLQLTNVGEHDIEEGDFLELQLKGILPEQFGVTYSDLTQTLDGDLSGAKKNLDGSILPGQFASLTFEGLSYLPDARGDIPRTFQVDLCYDYSSEATVAVCIADDVTEAITNAGDSKICQVNGIKAPKNSGGPVQITDFKQLPQGGSKISVIFTVSHVGYGDVYQAGSAAKCDDSLRNTDRNIVRLALALPSESTANIDCQGDFTNIGGYEVGDVTLFEGNPRTVTCTIEANNANAIIYEDLLTIEMDYAYGQTTELTAIIKDLGTSSDD